MGSSLAPSSDPPPPNAPDIAPSGSPASVADGVDHQLDPRWIVLEKRVGWIRAVTVSVVWFAIGWIAIEAAELSTGIALVLLALWLVLSIANAWWRQRRPGIAYRRASYRIDEDGIEIRRGILVRRVINVPRSRVQHTDVSQGPFERRFGLGTLTIHTAGSSHAMVPLPGLDHPRALRIRDYLLPRDRADVV